MMEVHHLASTTTTTSAAAAIADLITQTVSCEKAGKAGFLLSLVLKTLKTNRH